MNAAGNHPARPGSTMIRFVDGTPGTLPQKRNQTHRACEQCRKRKKRCVHLGTTVTTGHLPRRSEQSPSVDISTSPRIQQSNVTAITNLRDDNNATDYLATDSTNRTPPLQTVAAVSANASVSGSPSRVEEGDNARFVGDLNPQGIFLAATTPETVDGSSSGGVGVWLSRKAAARAKGDTPQAAPRRSSISNHTSDSLLSKMLLPLLEDKCYRLLPKPSDVDALISIYLDEIHPIFPVVQLQAYNAMPSDSPTKMILSQAVCLAASSNLRAKTFLALSTDTPMSSRSFARRMSSAILLSLDLRLVTDKVVLIQLLILLSLFTQLSKDSHTSAYLLSQAVSYAHTLGLHLRAQETRPDHREMTTLFCCLWALDRLNAAFHGRPVLMHERDSGRDLEACLKQQTDYFQLFLRVVLLLDRIIDLYRPLPEGGSTGWESDFPAFEDLVYSSCSPRTSSHLVATIETLYHAVAMLSCRSQSLKEPRRSSASYVRQCFSAVRVTSIVAKEFHGQLSQFPIVPYAVSLAIRFYYRELRLSKAAIFRTRALNQLQLACTVLRELGDFFSSTMFMVEMVEQTIREMDKVCSTMLNSHGEIGETFSNGDSRGDVEVAANTASLEIPAPNPNPGTVDPNIAQDGSPFNDHGRSTQPPVDYVFNASDPSMLENIPADLDIFEHFDPDFNLDAIDAFMGDPDMLAFPILADGSV